MASIFNKKTKTLWDSKQAVKDASDTMLQSARSRLVNISLAGLLWVGIVALPMFIARSFQVGLNISLFVHVAITALALVFVVGKQHLGLTARTWGLVCIAFASAFSSFLSYGIVGGGFIGMATLGVVVAALVLGRRIGLVVLCLSCTTFIVITLSVFNDIIKPAANLHQYLDSHTAWWMALAAYLLPAAMLVLGIEEMHVLLREVIASKVKNTRELEEKNIFLESLLQGTDSFILVTDQHLRVTACNNACLQSTGFSKTEIIGKDFTTCFFSPSEQEKVKAFFTTDSPQNHEDEWQTKQASTLIINWTNNRILSPDQTVHWLITGIDVSERKALQERIFHADKMESVGQLAGGVAHDFNNLLTGIMSSAELLNRHPSKAMRKKHIGNIVHAGKQATALTRKLLDFSRAESQRNERLDLNTIVRDAVQLVEIKAARGIIVEQKLSDGKLLVLGDVSQLLNVILNLGINAVDAMPNGGTLTISTQLAFIESPFDFDFDKSLKPGTYAEIIVTDTGVGIPKDKQSQIFEPFFTTKERGKGTGLGLPSVYATVSRHQGAIRMYSEEGKGTVFHIFLPCDAAQSECPAISPTIANSHQSKLSILLVEDEKIIRDNTALFLEEFDHIIYTASNGREALAILEKTDIDMVILDWLMPIMDGHQTLTAMHEEGYRQPVLVVSGFIPEFKQKGLFNKGSVAFLRKPYQQEELISRIHQISPQKSAASS